MPILPGKLFRMSYTKEYEASFCLLHLDASIVTCKPNSLIFVFLCENLNLILKNVIKLVFKSFYFFDFPTIIFCKKIRIFTVFGHEKFVWKISRREKFLRFFGIFLKKLIFLEFLFKINYFLRNFSVMAPFRAFSFFLFLEFSEFCQIQFAEIAVNLIRSQTPAALRASLDMMVAVAHLSTEMN